ncbi:MAG: hypothetical protein HPY90_15400 [Syntrophothermus sp.]|uniref:hypothetical protein n=1 Tax=Syntrophothermus sp. TaxID=2736299 RepID=UPI00257DCE93|nr:hypothetical protein [Syntrophothermus sp.]NSW84585.1 hypothetical protein [Syntrophothermus sp.]
MKNELLEEIGRWRDLLRGVGYSRSQIRQMIREYTGTDDLRKLPEEDLAKVVSLLRERHAFALRCRNLK